MILLEQKKRERHMREGNINKLMRYRKENRKVECGKKGMGEGRNLMILGNVP